MLRVELQTHPAIFWTSSKHSPRIGAIFGHFVMCSDPPSPWQKSDETHWSGQPEFKQDSYLQAVFVLKKPQESLFPKNQCSFIFLWGEKVFRNLSRFLLLKTNGCVKKGHCYHVLDKWAKQIRPSWHFPLDSEILALKKVEVWPPPPIKVAGGGHGGTNLRYVTTIWVVP